MQFYDSRKINHKSYIKEMSFGDIRGHNNMLHKNRIPLVCDSRSFEGFECVLICYVNEGS